MLSKYFNWTRLLKIKNKLHAFMEKKNRDRNVYNVKSDYWRSLQQEWFERGRSRKWYGRLRCVRVDEAIRLIRTER